MGIVNDIKEGVEKVVEEVKEFFEGEGQKAEAEVKEAEAAIEGEVEDAKNDFCDVATDVGEKLESVDEAAEQDQTAGNAQPSSSEPAAPATSSVQTEPPSAGGSAA